MSREWIPLPYMERAMEFILQRDGCGLMLDPGMRKTSITLAAIDILRYANEIRKTLVVAPLRVCKTVWRQEGEKWANFNHLKIVNLCGLKSVYRSQLIAADHHVYLINPESLLVVLPLLSKDFDLLVIDESTKFKDTQTLRFKGLRKVLHNFKRRLILTGTMIPNGLQDLFGQMFIVDFGDALGKYVSHFRMEFCYQRPGDAYGWYIKNSAPELIYKRVENRLMRMDIKDHIAMPELIRNYIPVELPAKWRAEYDKLEAAFVAQMNDTSIAVFNPAAVGTKLRQMANGFIYDDGNGAYPRRTIDLHDEKLDALDELVEEMQGRPLLVAYEFKADAEKIMARFDGSGDRPLAVDMGTAKDIEAVVNQFNRGELPLVIAHPGSVGHGLNLQEACNTVCWYGITWNLELYEQLNDRVYRSGQEASTVIVHHLVCQRTKDQDVVQALEGKAHTQNDFNAAIKRARA